MPVEPEQRQHWEKQDRESMTITVALVAQTIVLVGAIGGGFFWAGDTTRRVAALEAQSVLRAEQGERMAVVETQVKALYESQVRVEALLRDYLEAETKRR